MGFLQILVLVINLNLICMVTINQVKINFYKDKHLNSVTMEVTILVLINNLTTNLATIKIIILAAKITLTTNLAANITLKTNLGAKILLLTSLAALISSLTSSNLKLAIQVSAIKIPVLISKIPV